MAEWKYVEIIVNCSNQHVEEERRCCKDSFVMLLPSLTKWLLTMKFTSRRGGLTIFSCFWGSAVIIWRWIYPPAVRAVTSIHTQRERESERERETFTKVMILVTLIYQKVSSATAQLGVFANWVMLRRHCVKSSVWWETTFICW